MAYVDDCVVPDILKNTRTFIFKSQKRLRTSSLVRDNMNRLILKNNECYLKSKVIIKIIIIIIYKIGLTFVKLQKSNFGKNESTSGNED